MERCQRAETRAVVPELARGGARLPSASTGTTRARRSTSSRGPPERAKLSTDSPPLGFLRAAPLARVSQIPWEFSHFLMVRAEGFEPSTHALKVTQVTLCVVVTRYGVWYSPGAPIAILVSNYTPFRGITCPGHSNRRPTPISRDVPAGCRFPRVFANSQPGRCRPTKAWVDGSKTVSRTCPRTRTTTRTGTRPSGSGASIRGLRFRTADAFSGGREVSFGRGSRRRLYPLRGAYRRRPLRSTA